MISTTRCAPLPSTIRDAFFTSCLRSLESEIKTRNAATKDSGVSA
jgi:hypothetical protein